MVPNFLLKPMGSKNLMRLSLKKGAHGDLSRAACRKFGVFAQPAPARRGAYMGRKRWAQPHDRFFYSNQKSPFRMMDTPLRHTLVRDG
jgi:hypothetical protein